MQEQVLLYKAAEVYFCSWSPCTFYTIEHCTRKVMHKATTICAVTFEQSTESLVEKSD